MTTESKQSNEEMLIRENQRLIKENEKLLGKLKGNISKIDATLERVERYDAIMAKQHNRVDILDTLLELLDWPEKGSEQTAQRLYNAISQ